MQHEVHFTCWCWVINCIKPKIISPITFERNAATFTDHQGNNKSDWWIWIQSLLNLRDISVRQEFNSWGFAAGGEDGIQGWCHQDNHIKTKSPITDLCGSQTWEIFSPPVQWDSDESLHYNETEITDREPWQYKTNSETLAPGHLQLHTSPLRPKTGKSFRNVFGDNYFLDLFHDQLEPYIRCFFSVMQSMNGCIFKSEAILWRIREI